MPTKRVLVIGDGCTDRFIYGISVRLCPDAPVPVFTPVDTIEVGGMAKNVQANIISLNLSCDILCQPEPVEKTRYVDKKTNHTFIRIDTGENSITRISNMDLDALSHYDAIAISDYDKGFLHESDIQFICENHSSVFVDTKKHINSFCSSARFVKINEIEYENSKHTIVDDRFSDNLIVTLGSKGCVYKDVVYPVDKVEIKDMSGAGDTFMAGLIVEYLRTDDVTAAIKFANICATDVVQKKGVSTVQPENKVDL